MTGFVNENMSHKNDLVDTKVLARNIRIDVLKMVHRAKASHIGSCYSSADIVAVLYGTVLKFDRTNPINVDRSRFILSKGHAAACVYAALANVEILPKTDLESYGSDGSLFMTHISHKINGVEFSSGSLGHGLSFGVGKALAAKRRKKDWQTYVLLSDGEMDEGSNWEALMFAAHHKLDNLTAIIDYNKLQSLTTVQSTLNLEPLAKKLEAFGWSVIEVDGHDHAALADSLSSVHKEGMPKVVVAHTIKGKGIKYIENKVEWHYKSPNEDQMNEWLKELGAPDA